MSFRFLQRSVGTLDILVYLHKEKTADVKTLTKDLHLSNTGFYSAAERLKRLGFLFEEENKGYPTHVYYELTPRGEQVADYLAPIASMLKDTTVGMEEQLERLREMPSTPEDLRKMHALDETLCEEHYLRGGWETAFTLASESLKAAEKLGETSLRARSHMWIGKIKQKEDQEACVKHLELAISLLEAGADPAVVAEAYYLLGSHFERKGRYEEAREQFTNCVKFAERGEDKVRVGLGKAGHGRVLGRLGEFKESYRLLQEAREHLEEIGEQEELPSVLSSLAFTCSHIDVKEAMNWERKAIDLAEQVGDIRAQSYGLMNAAGFHLQLDENKSALKCLTESFKLAQKLGETKLQCSIALQEASVFQKTRKLRSAAVSAERALGLAQSKGFIRDKAFAYFILGTIANKKKITQILR